MYDTPEWMDGDAVTKQFAESLKTREYEMVAGPYTEALQAEVGSECRWFTTFRHPVSRLVSAYFFCQKMPEGPLCASRIVKAKDITLLEFARHWETTP